MVGGGLVYLQKKEISHLVCKHSIWGWGEKI